MPITSFVTDDRETRGPADGRADFDVLYGRWRVAHRRLQRRLEGDTQWDEFAGMSEMKPLLGGLGNVDDNVIGCRPGPIAAPACACSMPRRNDGRSGGSTAAIPAGGRRSSAASIGAWEASMPTKPCAAARSASVSSGRRSRRPRPAGSRPSHPTRARAGRSTGTCVSRGWGEHALGLPAASFPLAPFGARGLERA